MRHGVAEGKAASVATATIPTPAKARCAEAISAVKEEPAQPVPSKQGPVAAASVTSTILEDLAEDTEIAENDRAWIKSFVEKVKPLLSIDMPKVEAQWKVYLSERKAEFFKLCNDAPWLCLKGQKMAYNNSVLVFTFQFHQFSMFACVRW